MKYYETTNEGSPHTNKILIQWGQPIIEFGEAHIDATGWRPDAEIARAAVLTGQGGTNLKGVYDFPDGKDTGARPPRQAGMDIVDVQNAMEAISKDAKRRETDNQSQKQATDALKNAMKDALSESIGQTEAEN